MAEKLYFPEVNVQKEKDGLYRATAGLAISSILDPSLRVEQDDERGRLYMDHVALLGTITAWPQHVTLSLNMVSRPDRAYPLRGSIETTILLNVTGTMKEEALAEVLSRFGVLTALLYNHLPNVEFKPIQSIDHLKDRSKPFEPHAVVSIQRRHEKLQTAMPVVTKGQSVGFISVPSNKERSDSQNEVSCDIPFVFPWAPSSQDISSVAEALLWHPAPIWLHTRIRPGKTSEKSLHELLGALKWCEDLLNNKTIAHETLEIQTLALREAVGKRYQQMSESVLKCGVFLSSPVDLDEAMISAIAQTISVKRNRSGAVMTLEGGYHINRLASDKLMDPDFFPESEPYTVQEATCAYRIPHPEGSLCPGFPLQKFRTALAYSQQHLDSDASGLLDMGVSVHQGYEQAVLVDTKERMRHTCLLGQTGTGKSTLLENMIVQDIHNGYGLCLLDPHGELVETVLHQYPKNRKDDLILIDFVDREFPVAMNFLDWQTIEERDFIIDELYASMDRIYDMQQTGGPMFEMYFRGMLRLLMGDHKREDFTPTLLEFELLFTDKRFRRYCKKDIQDQQILNFIEVAEEAGGEAKLANMAPYVTSKLNRFFMDTTLKRIIGQEKMALNIREIMDNGKVVLVNLGKGNFGSAISAMIAGQIVARFKAATMSRIDLPPEARRDFFLYVDEFQNVAHDSFIELLAEARKYRLGLILANQYADQLEKIKGIGGSSVLPAVLGNVGTIVSFRLGIRDASLLESVYTPAFKKNDLSNLPNYSCYVNMDTGGDRPFSFSMKGRYEKVERDEKHLQRLRDYSRSKYGQEVSKVDEMINFRTEWIKELIQE